MSPMAHSIATPALLPTRRQAHVLPSSGVKPKLASGAINLDLPTCYRLGRCQVEEGAGEFAVVYDDSRRLELSTTTSEMDTTLQSVAIRKAIRSAYAADSTRMRTQAAVQPWPWIPSALKSP
jgi:hypothetical protein